jgi:choline dehydrogenase-like flavoprotein
VNQATQCDLDRLVDGDLRVQSIENLFVVDASVIPRITTGPPQWLLLPRHGA